LLNSCPASARAMAKLLPLARRWGAAVVGLAMDARGIPATSAERFKLAEKFVGRALDEGIALDDIYVDPLMLTAAQGRAAQAFETLREIKQTLGVRTIMGVSNVSHGLPMRDLLNAAAFLYAAGAGLDLAIVDPLDERIREAMGTASALAGGEREVASYVEAFLEKPSRKKVRKRKVPTPGDELYEAVVDGRRERAAAAAARAVKNSPKPFAINNKFIVAALEEVGRLFERKEYYLPQVIRAAEAGQAAFSVIEKATDKESRRPAGRVVFATVAGDVHDIGKSVVAAVLRSHGFDVYDLGKNVSTPRVVESAKARRAGGRRGVVGADDDDDARDGQSRGGAAGARRQGALAGRRRRRYGKVRQGDRCRVRARRRRGGARRQTSGSTIREGTADEDTDHGRYRLRGQPPGRFRAGPGGRRRLRHGALAQPQPKY